MISCPGKVVKTYDSTDISTKQRTCWTLGMRAVIQEQQREKKRLPLPNLGEGKDNRGGIHSYLFKEYATSRHKTHIGSYVLILYDYLQTI
jgi:hypothetical protein